MTESPPLCAWSSIKGWTADKTELVSSAKSLFWDRKWYEREVKKWEHNTTITPCHTDYTVLFILFYFFNRNRVIGRQIQNILHKWMIGFFYYYFFYRQKMSFQSYSSYMLNVYALSITEHNTSVLHKYVGAGCWMFPTPQ